MMTQRASHPEASRRGFILIAVLWILAALSTLVVIFSIYLANTALSLSLSDGDLQSESLVYAALELTAYQVTPPGGILGARTPAPAGSQREQVRPPPARGDFTFRLGRANVAVAFVSERSRIDINAAPPELLASFFATLGVPRGLAEQYVQRIAGWSVAPDQTGGQPQSNQGNQGKPNSRDEEALYRAAGKTYGPRGAPFAHIDELYLVVDIPPAVIERAKPFLTVYTGRGQVDVLDAAPEVVAAIPGVTPNLLNQLAELRRNGEDPEKANNLLANMPMQNAVTIEGGDTYRVEVRIRYDNGRQAAAAVVVRIGAGDKPYGVMWWRDGFDVLSDVRLLGGQLRR